LPATSSKRYLYGHITADGGLISDVEDMARCILMYLGRGALEGTRILSEDSVKAMMEPRVAAPPVKPGFLPGRRPGEAPGRADRGGARPGDDAGRGPAGAHPQYYGFGLHHMPDFFGRRLVGHGGSVLVATAHMAFLPDEGCGVMLLANGSGYSLGHLAHYALASLLGEDPEELPFLRVERLLGNLTGTYETFRGTVRASVKRRADFLVLEVDDDFASESMILVPESLTEDDGLFFTLADGQRQAVEFHRREGRVELLVERYKLRRVGG